MTSVPRLEGIVRSLKILVVDDYERFRRFVCSLLKQRSSFQIVEASDGTEAVQKAKQLGPDLILLDIGLPNLNGIEVARRLAPDARILFLSQESSPDVVREALSLAAGYVHKPRAQSDLMPAIEAVLAGRRFTSSSLGVSEGVSSQASHGHEIFFSSDDEPVLLNGLTRFTAKPQ